MNEYDLEHLDNDMKYRPSSKDSQIKLAGHIFSWAENRLICHPKSTYLILSCFNGIPIRCSDLERWLDLSHEDIQELEAQGLADLYLYEEQYLVVRIPVIMTTLSFHSAAERESAEEWAVLRSFTERFLREVRHEEVGVIQPAQIATIMERYIKMLVERREYSKEKKDLEEAKDFLLGCIAFCITMCAPGYAKRLYEQFREPLTLDEDPLLNDLLRIFDDALFYRSDFTALTDFLEKYMDRFEKNPASLTQNELTAIRSVTKRLLDNYWTNLIRVCSEYGTVSVHNLDMEFLVELFRRGKVLADVQAKIKVKELPLIENTVERYSKQALFFIVVRRTSYLRLIPCQEGEHGANAMVRLADDQTVYELIVNDLKPILRLVDDQTSPRRLEVLEMVRILTDLQFLFAVLCSFMPSGLRSDYLKLAVYCGEKLSELFRQYYPSLPLDLHGKILCLRDFLKKEGLGQLAFDPYSSNPLYSIS